MGEVYHFNEVTLKSVSGTIETTICPFATGVAVDLRREMFDVANEDGQVVKRFEYGKGVTVTIGKAYDSDLAWTDGDSLKIYHQYNGGTVTHQVTNVYLTDQGWTQRENDVIRYDVKMVGQSVGTV